MREIDVITAVRRRLEPSPAHRGEPFRTDAEVVELDGRLLAITVDEFSAEDRLPDRDAAALGWNLVVATLSDLLAAGAAPRFMLNALVTAPWMDATWLEELSGGMQQALGDHEAAMLGGDVGSGSAWRFDGVGLGVFPDGWAPRDRRVQLERGVVVVTGTFGDGNLAAVDGGASSPRFEVRCAEAAALSTCSGAAAIDTSDGLGPALETLARCNEGLGLWVETEAVPLSPGVEALASATELPRAAFLLGSAGEYELLALAPEDALSVLLAAGWTRIGSFCASDRPGVTLRHAAGELQLPPLPDPRDVDSANGYRARLVEIAKRIPCASRDTASGPPAGGKERS